MGRQLKVIPIGDWVPYSSLSKAKDIQSDNLTGTSLHTGTGEIKFVYTDKIAKCNKKIEDIIFKHRESLSSENDERFSPGAISEACFNAQIEYAKIDLNTARSLIETGREAANKDERMFLNILYATEILHTKVPDELNYVLGIVWNRVVEGVCDNQNLRGYDGNCYRTGDVRVGSYIPPSAYMVTPLMRDLIEFICNDDLDDYPIIKAILIHYAFESIHPYCDGNGRLGRMLMQYYLCNRGYTVFKDIPLSKYIFNFRPLYYKNLEESENYCNDCTPFLEYMLDVILYILTLND